MRSALSLYVALAAAVLVAAGPGFAGHDHGLVGWWQFEGNGDDSAHGHDGVLLGGATTAPGHDGQALSLDGRDDWCRVEHSPELNGDITNALTTAAWIKATISHHPRHWRGIIGKITSGEPRPGYLMRVTKTGRFRAGIWVSHAGGVGTALISQTIVEDDRWHHVASTYDGQTFRLFVDGVEEGSIAYSDGIAPNTAPVQIGWDPFTDGGRLNNRFSGLIDDARIYNRGLAACEIAELAGTGSCNSPPDATAAAPTPESIWPPNNKMVDVTIGGVTDPDGDDVTITITGIINEETGTDDAGGIGTSTAQVRASRDGKGDGRVYVISFNASDGNGGTDTGTVTVTVPHDQGKRRGRAKAAAAVRGASWGELKESVR